MRGSQEPVAGNRGRSVNVWLLGGLLAFSFALPASAGAAGITFIAPPGARTYPDQSEGPVGYAEAPVAFRTTDTRPTIGIQADGGTELQCHFDDVFATQTCGGPEPGCAAICGSFQPAAPLGADSDQFTRGHFLAVDLNGADGNPVASVWVNIDVDTTPPVTQLRTAGGVLTTLDSGLVPLRPTFNLQVSDSNSVGTNVDTVACAWGPAATNPAFRPCGGSSGPSTFVPSRLPARHRLYRLQVRGTDDFGRSSTASGAYDPVPCALSVRRPARIASLLSSGIFTRLSCDATRHVAVAIYAFMVDGDRSASPRGAVSDNPILGLYGASSRTSAFTVTRRLRLYGAARQALRHARSLGLVLAAGDPDKVSTGLADDSLSYQVLSLRR
ncbi:MAG TPA: hypothetical protein VHW96_24590 [Solirubrobacteraceae bacterium]|nr:hypothetical protein [Solirubrobacteraceae bacterium]